MAAAFILKYFIDAQQVAEIFDLMAYKGNRVFCDFFFHALDHALEERRISALDPKHIKGEDQPLIERRYDFELGRKVILTFSGDNLLKIAALAPKGKYDNTQQWMIDAVTNYKAFVKARPGFSVPTAVAGIKPN